MKTIALVPVFNEAPKIINVLDELERYVDFILIVDDGSWDQSEAVVVEWQKDGHLAEMIALDHHRGMSGALLAGYARILQWRAENWLTDDDLVVKIDADGQHDPREIKQMRQFLIDRDLDHVRGRRQFDKYPSYKRMGNQLMSGFVSLLAGKRFYDVESGFSIQRVATIPAILDYAVGWGYSLADEIVVIMPRTGFKLSDDLVVSIPYFQSHTRLRDVFINAAACLAVWMKLITNRPVNRHWEATIAKRFPPKKRAA